MTTTPVLAAQTAREDTAPADWAIGLIDAAAHIAAHPGVRLPKPGTWTIPVRGTDRQARLDDLEEIAASWGTSTFDRNGTRMMARRFGPVEFTAHVGPKFAKHDEYLAHAAGQDAAGNTEHAA